MRKLSKSETLAILESSRDELNSAVGELSEAQHDLVLHARAFTESNPNYALINIDFSQGVEGAEERIRKVAWRLSLYVFWYRLFPMPDSEIPTSYALMHIARSIEILNDVVISVVTYANRFFELKDPFLAVFLTRVVKKTASSRDSLMRISGNLELLNANAPWDLPTVDWSFIADDRLRQIMERDYGELQNLVIVRSMKSIVVMLGSIIEAVLVYVLGEWERKDPQKIRELITKHSPKASSITQVSLENLIKIAADLDILDADTRRQADILREYRNCIHPSREIRDKVQIDDELVHALILLFQRIVRAVTQMNNPTGVYNERN